MMGESEVDYLGKQCMKGGRLLGGSERACSLLLYGLWWEVWRS